MTYEEALQSVLRYCSEECGKIDTCRGEDKECAEAAVIKALEKQIPKKPFGKPEQPEINFVKVEHNDEVEPTNDAVQHPSHYTQGGIECIEAVRASMTADGFCDYCKGNIIKYIWRWRDKGGVEDLRKASVYLDWLINAADVKEKRGENSK